MFSTEQRVKLLKQYADLARQLGLAGVLGLGSDEETALSGRGKTVEEKKFDKLTLATARNAVNLPAFKPASKQEGRGTIGFCTGSSKRQDAIQMVAGFTVFALKNNNPKR